MATNDSKEKIDSSEDLLEKLLEENRKFKLLRKIVIRICFFNTILAIQYVLLGIIAKVFYEEKTYLFIFGMLCLLHIISAPLVYITLKKVNRTIFLVISLLNLVWITAIIILLLVYKLLMTNEQFDNDLTFHMSSLFYVVVSLALALCYYLMIKEFDVKNKTVDKDSKLQEKEDEKGTKPISEVPVKGKEDKKNAKTKHHKNDGKTEKKKSKIEAKTGKKK